MRVRMRERKKRNDDIKNEDNLFFNFIPYSLFILFNADAVKFYHLPPKKKCMKNKTHQEHQFYLIVKNIRIDMSVKGN